MLLRNQGAPQAGASQTHRRGGGGGLFAVLLPLQLLSLGLTSWPHATVNPVFTLNAQRGAGPLQVLHGCARVSSSIPLFISSSCGKGREGKKYGQIASFHSPHTTPAPRICMCYPVFPTSPPVSNHVPTRYRSQTPRTTKRLEDLQV